MKKILSVTFLFFLGIFLSAPLVLAAETSEIIDPVDNPMCWNLDQCQNDWDNNGKPDGTFADATDKNSQDTCGPELGFCYPNNEDFELSVSLPIAGKITSTVSDLGDYIGKMYIFLLGISSAIVVVNFMIAGFQYVIAPAGGDVAKAKDKMKNSVIGLVLLVCAALILSIVNPQTLYLKSFSVPKSRTVLFLGDNMRCEILKQQGFSFDEDRFTMRASTCGLTSKVLKDPKGVDLVEPYECVWTGCEGDSYVFDGGMGSFKFNKVCVPGAKADGGSGNAACISCGDIVADPSSSEDTGLRASSQLCSTLTPDFTITQDSRWHAECVLTYDVGFEISDTLDIFNNGECAVIAYDCSNVNTCSDYDRIKAVNNDGSEFLDAFVMSNPFDYSKHAEICTSNPCKSPSKTELQKGCQQDFSATLVAVRAEAALGTTGISEVVLAFWNSLTGLALNGLSCKPIE